MRCQDRVKTCQRPVKDVEGRSRRVWCGGMTFESALLLVIVTGLLIYLVAALVRPEKF
jgi:K+-transporting ATPase KdpF subunit